MANKSIEEYDAAMIQAALQQEVYFKITEENISIPVTKTDNILYNFIFSHSPSSKQTYFIYSIYGKAYT